jgi:parallel beta-helix repeat protein
MRKFRIGIVAIAVISLTLLAATAFAGQGVQRLLYTVPNTTFIEQPAGESVVTINDASGSIESLQTAINNARDANPDKVIVIRLKRGAIYTVTGAGLVLGSRQCLVAEGAMIRAANSSVTAPLITIASGATRVSVAGGTLDGLGANIVGIFAPAASRVNIDLVTVRNCGLDCIQLHGNGNSTYDNEMAVTRCDVSGSPAHAGISVRDSTQTIIADNNCHDNAFGIWLSCAWAVVANNTCHHNSTGISINSGADNVVTNNTCNNNGTGIRARGSENMITSNSVGSNSTVGIGSEGGNNTFIDNLFTPGNASNFISAGSGNRIVAYKALLSASGQNYFYPPLIDDQHTTTIVNGMGRTDLTIGSTTIASVQSQYNAARSANPNNVIVLHLNGAFTVGSSPLTLSANTCVLLNGTIQVTSSTTASAVIRGDSQTRISISGGVIDGGNRTGRNAIHISNSSMVQVDRMTLRNFGPATPRAGGSDIIHFSGGSTPYVVTRCFLNGGSARGIWLQLNGPKSVISDNEVTNCNQDGVDCDSSTRGCVAKFNYCHDLVRYGVFIEQSASNNVALGNICNNDGRDINLFNNSDTPRGPVQRNTVAFNCLLGNNGIRNGSTSIDAVATSHNFLFNNTVVNASIQSQQVGEENYYSQNYHVGSLSTSGAETFFNSAPVDGYLQLHDSNSGLAVVAQNASTVDGAVIVTAQPSPLGNGSDNDEWQFIPTDSGYYQIKNKNSGLVMAVQDAALTRGAIVIQSPYAADTTFNDEWLIRPVGNGLYNFINRRSGLYLDVTGASKTEGAQLIQWSPNGGANQQFSLVADGPLGG